MLRSFVLVSIALAVSAQQGPPVSAKCKAAFEKVLSDKAVTQAETIIRSDNDKLLDSLNSTCKQIKVTHRCATTLDWTAAPYSQDVTGALPLSPRPASLLPLARPHFWGTIVD